MLTGPAPPLLSVAPFVAMLVTIAVCPLWVPRWWEPNRNKALLAALLGVPVVLLYLARRPAALRETAAEYVSFVLLLAVLYVIAGGVHLTGNLEATPLTNTAFLAVGAGLASLLGTTGASMLLIRPLLRTNRQRTRVRHTVVFFIFLVSNVGGLLTPLGDPPLLLGYLHGVPFTWTLRLWPLWSFAVGVLLIGYFAWDSLLHAREPQPPRVPDRASRRPLRVAGALNVVWLVGVVGAAALLGAPWREATITGLAVFSLVLTPGAIRHANAFTVSPMIEVAVLFAGIFLTMIPALELLHARGHELGMTAPWEFFWAAGVLSSFLDSAPAYLASLALAQGLGLSPEVIGVPHRILAAISAGAVFMGANTYVGNAPNFMVKAIAEEARVPVPSFFAYMGLSGAVLLPLFVLVTWLFFV